MKSSKNVKKLLLIIVVAFLFNFLVIFLNAVAAMISIGVERRLLYIMIQWIIPVFIFNILKRDHESLKDMGLSRERVLVQMLIGVLFGLLLSFFLTMLPKIIAGEEFKLFLNVSNMGIVAFVSELLYYTAGVSVSEELLFRGYIYKKVIDIKKSGWFAAMVSSAAFGFMHIFGKNLYQMIFSFFFGIILCLVRTKVKHCTLLSLIVAHGIYGTIVIFSF